MKVLFLSHLTAAEDPRRELVGDEGEQVRPIFEALGCELTVVDVTEYPAPDPAPWDGVVVGGSVGSANDREPWRVALEDWLRRYQSQPLLGICGGHQLLARALGARVQPLPVPQVGLYPLELPEIEGFTGEVIQLHKDIVLDLPPGAHLWARDRAGIQALRYPGHRWTVQFHPEFTSGRARSAGLRLAGKPASEWSESGLDRAMQGGRALLSSWLRGLG